MKNKKGISIMIGYILLVSAALAMSVLIFVWMKSYVPTDTLECPDGVSVYLDGINYDEVSYKLSFVLKNNGRFDVGGYYIHATTDEGQEIATLDLTGILGYSQDNSGIMFDSSAGSSENVLEVDDVSSLQTFNPTEEIFEIEILPFRYQDSDGVKRKVTCNDATVREVVHGLS